jgi:peptide/nickel transport system permease protein
MRTLTFWQRLGRAVRGSYFILGAVVVALLLVVAVLGPELAPHNPHTVKRLQWIDGELHKAPFAPSDLYPLGTDDLGRDQLSLLLFGARTTLVMAFAATTLRLLLGVILGIFAGWWPASPFDRAVTGLVDFLAAIPGLILAMLLVFAVGIQRGQIAFVVALSLVGWGEVAQIVRGHVLTIRKKLYIMAARSLGLSPLGVLSRHVLPNLLATLLALAALEMGNVLLLLGELGFVSIFVGGGRVGFEMGSFETRHYFDVPDWGAMLGTSWRWFRSYPWYPLVPAAAFFVSILGFNLFGYGLQRFVERGRFHPSGWSVLRFLLVTGALLLGARSLLRSSGIEAQFARQVQQFDIDRAWSDVSYLARPALEGRSSGSDGAREAAHYIADQFKQAGLTPITRDGSYFQHYTAVRGRVTAEPSLELLGEHSQGSLTLVDRVSLDPLQAFNAEGQTDLDLVVLGEADRLTVVGLTNQALLLLDPEAAVYRSWTGSPRYGAILRVVPDDELAPRNDAPEFDVSAYSSRDRLPGFPNLLIAQSAAEELLAAAGLNLEELQASVRKGEEVKLHTEQRIRLTYGLVYEEVSATNVCGYIPGLDGESQGERVLLTATYTGLPPENGSVHPGADENASGVAAMLETARLLRDLDMIPKRTVVFAAFDEVGGRHFVNDPVLPTRPSDTWTAVILHGLGAGEPRLARLEEGSGFARAFDQSARRFGVSTQKLADWQFFFVSSYSRLAWGDPTVLKSYQGLVVDRPGDSLSGTPSDTLDHLDTELLAEAGRAVAHYVMVVSFR